MCPGSLPYVAYLGCNWEKSHFWDPVSSFNKYLCNAKDLQGRGLRAKNANNSNTELKIHQPNFRMTASYTMDYKLNMSQELMVFSKLIHVTRESWSLLLRGYVFLERLNP